MTLLSAKKKKKKKEFKRSAAMIMTAADSYSPHYLPADQESLLCHGRGEEKEKRGAQTLWAVISTTLAATRGPSRAACMSHQLS